MSANATSDAGAMVTYAAPTTTGGVAPVEVSCTRPSGSLFTVGPTTVQCNARDSVAQSTSCLFTVTVAARIPQLSRTRFLAFGDSLTSGEITRPVSDSLGARGPNHRYIVVPSASYPSRLGILLRGRYTGQSTAIEINNAGLPGEFAEDAALRLPNLLANYRPTVLLLFHGYNDLSAGVAVSRIALALDVMAKEGRNRGARVFIATLPPPRVGGTKPVAAASLTNLNDRIRQTAAGEGAVLVDLYTALVPDIPRYIGIDGLHPTEAGYQRIADTFFDAIRNALEVR